MAYIPGETGTWDNGIAWDDTDFWLDESSPAPAPVLVNQKRGKGKKQQIYTQGPWAYR
jgi:hypothetical protein